ncbi:CPBP family intramembrane glutamic endopeptidase [Phytomonospora endophytica]|uniref:Membrane protease YdiL (CAAX protease family) n=1 Tax=Phytomonospora endophytica TaxID=714109 RepID=A0A841FNK6_9ACTN|nr:type II CAAX endopeptidase family protein [Phytomonospora endophytica]MBB6035142.1 membrane protease YdiL (CAAX protease family) [Phytomonospora endophytica]GIG64109.1 membrane protein [Phytomonospora endophytica]
MTTATADPLRRQRGTEVLLVLAISLGQSAVYSLVSIIAKLTAPGGLAQATSTLNGSAAPGRPWLDLTYQLLGIVFALVPAAFAVHLLARDGVSPWRTIGLDLRRPLFDLGSGVGLTALIGIPGLALYFVARELGLNTTVVAEALPGVWWAVPVLILAAVQNSLLEEVVVVGYLMTRLRQMRYGTVAVILSSATLRGAYHLYQGFGGFVGNFVMGLVFGYWYKRTGRIGGLVVAHALLDIVAFVGFALFKEQLSWLTN